MHIKRFQEVNEQFHYSDYIDLYLLQGCIEGMRPNRTTTGDEFKQKLREFNSQYACKEEKRLPNNFAKDVAYWIDLNLIQDVIDRMNPVLCNKAYEYKKDLKNFLS